MSKTRIAVSLILFSGLLLVSRQSAAWPSPLNKPAHPSEQSTRPPKTDPDKEQSQENRKDEVKLIHKAKAAYPQEAKDKGVEGKVVLEFTINEKGEVIEAGIKEGPELLHKAALDAARQSRFANPLKQKFVGTLTYDFRLGGEKEKPPSPPAQQSDPQPPTEESRIKLIERVEPDYPQEASDKGITGKVIVEITIDEKGEVSEARVKEGPELLHQAALDAVRKWRFTNPGKQKVVATIEFNFGI